MDTPDVIRFRSQVLPLFFLTTIFFLNFTTRIIFSPLLPTVSEDMNLTRDQAGSFFLISASGYFISLLCSGFVSSKLFHKKTIVLSAVGSGIALMAAGFSLNLWSMRIGLFMMGMSTALYLPSGMAVLTASVDSRNWGKAIGVHELAPNLSFLLAPIICEALLLLISWRQVLLVVGTASIISGLCFYLFSGIQDFKGEPPKLKSVIPLLKTPSFWMMIALFSAGVTGTFGVYAMLPLYLVKTHGMLQAEANTLMTLSRVAVLPMSFVAGWLSDRIGIRQTLAGVLLLTGISTVLTGILSGAFIKAIIFIQPLFAVSFFPPAFAALSRVSSKDTRNIIISFTISVAFLVGSGVMPGLIGIAGEKDLFAFGFVLVGAWILAGAIVPVFLKFHEESQTIS
jgi:NNP family nitrate/nitrite transporter-like MFS transporter